MSDWLYLLTPACVQPMAASPHRPLTPAGIVVLLVLIGLLLLARRRLDGR